MEDLATPILAGDPQLDDDTRANLWDAFHNSKNPNELMQTISGFGVPEDTAQRLLQAKTQSLQPAAPKTPVEAALQTISRIPEEQLSAAEAHPTVFKALVEKLSPENQEEKPPLSPRPDGEAHFKPIPPNHYRILASDGGVHDVPHENIEKARQIDPLLHVLNA